MYFQCLQEKLVVSIRQRVRNGELTERGLARLAGISQPHIHNVLKGARILSPELADQLLRSMHLSLLDLNDSVEAHLSGNIYRFQHVPLFNTPIGPGNPYCETYAAGDGLPFRSAELACWRRPAAARLSADPAAEPRFRAGDLVLLDRCTKSRRDPCPGSIYVIETDEGALLRYIRKGGRTLHVGSEANLHRPAYWDYSVPLNGRDILETVRARVVWMGRKMETATSEPAEEIS